MLQQQRQQRKGSSMDVEVDVAVAVATMALTVTYRSHRQKVQPAIFTPTTGHALIPWRLPPPFGLQAILFWFFGQKKKEMKFLHFIYG